MDESAKEKPVPSPPETGRGEKETGVDIGARISKLGTLKENEQVERAREAFGADLVDELHNVRLFDADPKARAKVENLIIPRVNDGQTLKVFIDYFLDARHADGVELQIAIQFVNSIFEQHPEKTAEFLEAIRNGEGGAYETLRSMIEKRNPLFPFAAKIT